MIPAQGATRATPVTPQLSMTVPTLDAVCDGIGRANVLTGVFVDIVRKRFSQASPTDYAELAQTIWSPGEGTGIVIESAARWTPETGGVRPAVLVRRNKLQTERVSIGHQRQSPIANAQGNPHYSIVWSGTYTIFCLSGKPLQSEILGHEISREILQFSGVLREELRLMRLDVLDVDTMGVLEEHKQMFVTPVNVFVGFSEAWVVERQAPPFRGLSLSALLQQD